MSIRFRISILIDGMVKAVLFGIDAVTVLSIPSLQEQWKFLIHCRRRQLRACCADRLLHSASAQSAVLAGPAMRHGSKA